MLSYINLKNIIFSKNKYYPITFYYNLCKFETIIFYITGLFNLKKYKDGKTSPKVIAKSIDIDFNPS